MTLNRREFVAAAAAHAALGASLRPRAHALSTGSLVHDAVVWPEFLRQHDLLWDRVPQSWPEAPFLGNGRYALYMHAGKDGRSLRFAVDHIDAYDHRDASWGTVAYGRARYHVGDFLLETVGTITGASLRLHLCDACLRGQVHTSAGSVQLEVFVHALQDLIDLRVRCEAGEMDAAWRWQPGEPVTSRGAIRTAAQQQQYEQLYGNPVKLWVDNPPGQQQPLRSGVSLFVQSLLVGGGYATAWCEAGSGSERRLLISTVTGFPNLVAERAREQVIAARRRPRGALFATHRAWWARFYPQSFITLPEARWESFYWIQMYKYGCAAPKGRGVIDTHGPWLQVTSWPYITWNLNSQISYWALQPSNRVELHESLCRTLYTSGQALASNVRPVAFQGDSAVLAHCSQQDLLSALDEDRRYAREWGNLLWACHSCWLQWRFVMNRDVLREGLFPLLRRAVNFYLHSMEQGPDGVLHLPATYSPETSTTRDCNYDLALLRWACGALLEASRMLALHDPLESRWKEVLEHLAEFPTDENGYRIGADLTAQAHRHFSHLLMIYPLHLVTPEDPKERPLIQRSVDFWLASATSGNAAAGFTLAVGACMRATLGDGDAALDLLRRMLDAGDGKHRISPTTMYAESGQNIESPLAMAQALHEMLLQSWGGCVRVFPAVPSSWKGLTFHRMRAEGSFLISAHRQDGYTEWVEITSLVGETCRLRCDFPAEVECTRSSGSTSLRRGASGDFLISLMAGETLLLRRTPIANARVEPLRHPDIATNSFGVHSAATQPRKDPEGGSTA